MQKITVPYKDKSYDFHCFATILDGEAIFCFSTPDHQPHPVLQSDCFFVKVNPINPAMLSTNGYADTKESAALVETATKMVVERFVTITPNPNYHK